MKIECVQAPKGYAKTYTVCFEGGTRKRVHEAVLLSMGLRAGLELGDADMERLDKENNEASAKARAVRILASSNVSTMELKKRLRQRGEQAEDVETATQWLSDLHVLNDASVARQAVQSAVKKGYGAHRIRQILYEKGIDKSLWDEAMEDLPQADASIDEYIRKKLRDPSDRREQKRVADALLRRGHSWSDIRAGLQRCSEIPEEWEEN